MLHNIIIYFIFVILIAYLSERIDRADGIDRAERFIISQKSYQSIICRYIVMELHEVFIVSSLAKKKSRKCLALMEVLVYVYQFVTNHSSICRKSVIVSIMNIVNFLWRSSIGLMSIEINMEKNKLNSYL